MSRAFLVVMDSAGIGGAPDAAQYFNDGRPDTGANTIGHIAKARGLHMPHLDRLGLGAAIRLASGLDVPELGALLQGRNPEGLWGAAVEVSRGKDTPSGHWELAGVPVPWDWHVFPNSQPAFPPDLSQRIAALAGTEGILGDCHASGTAIIESLGEAHLRTGWPICYTSVDSVLQIAAHEESFGLDRLLHLCRDVADIVHPMRVGRVIARPFVGQPGDFRRTPNRRDYALEVPGQTILDLAQAAGRRTHAIGKIGDIFSHRGIDHLHKGKSDADLAEHLIRLVSEAGEGSLTFANFVEFDSLYGHRRDVEGYGDALEWFDTVVGRMLPLMRAGDLVIFTADHGNDPTWQGTDHTRECVPVLGWGLGERAIGMVSFADVGASIADHLGIAAPAHGQSFLGAR